MKIKIIDDDIQFIDSLKNNLTGEFDHVLINGSTSLMMNMIMIFIF